MGKLSFYFQLIPGNHEQVDFEQSLFPLRDSQGKGTNERG